MNGKIISTIGAVFFLTTACATTAPKELTEARAAYQRAAGGPAAQLTPVELHVAHEALLAAEQGFEDEGDSVNSRDRAYIAIRRAEWAEARAGTVKAENEALEWQRRSQLTRAEMQAETKNDLDRAKEKLAGKDQQLAQQQQQVAEKEQQLNAERMRRQESEQRAEQAKADLARIAAVKEETRGTVITLSGGVLFASGKSELLPTAQAKLSEIADVLVKSNPDAQIAVEGHTDSQGSATFNQELSARRAEAVRNYLVSHGIASDRVSAQGYGPSRPLTDNKSTEGRANNRRVEIVVQPTI